MTEEDTVLDSYVKNALDGASIAHLAYTLSDGSPNAIPVWVGTHEGEVVFFTGPDSFKARNLRRDPRVAISIAPVDRPFPPVSIRGRVDRWIDGEAGWAIIDEMAVKYTGSPYPRDQERIVAVVEPTRQIVGARAVG